MRAGEIIEPNWSLDKRFGDEIVWVSAERIRQSWELDRDAYFDGPQHPNALKGRLERFAAYVASGQPITPSEISLTQEGEVVFTNGRHRFVWMIQNGIERLPVLVPPLAADQVRRRYA